ncbi:MAG: aminoacyl-tRNA hydrolase [Hungatella sp.]|nr:aminoacyl-tRNA hydrolase [Hungatella sp.]
MYIIAGLGNPGKQYESTRHNVGFCVIDILADRMGVCVEEKKHKALCGRGILEGHKIVLLKPQTFMNLSGESIRGAADYYKVEKENIMIIYDDISLEPGQLRIRKKGSAGGHNGIKNIIAHLGTQEFPRIKVGIGDKPRQMDLADYVLSRFSKGEQELMDKAYRDAADAAAMVIGQGMDPAMNHYNGKRKTEEA